MVCNFITNAWANSNTTHNWKKLPPKSSEISRAFQQYANQSNLINIEFKILENILCTLLYDFRWKTISKEWKVNEPLMSLLLRFWDREPSSLCSHVLKSFYKKLFYPHFICENYINSIFIMSILNLVISCIWQQKCTWYLGVI